jgi:diguanylate cyclase (GGDEF)-like protein/putative nucleotidyltransferase with HDIG domain
MDDQGVQEPVVRVWRDEVDAAAVKRCEAAIDEMGQLPVFDGTVQKILKAVEDTETSNEQLIAAMESDATFAANLLRFANSAGRSHPIRARSVRQAVMFVGRDALRRLTLETATFRFLERIKGNGRAAAGQMHLHSLAVALAAASAAEQGGNEGDVAHLSGLLHDVGKLVLPVAYGSAELDDISTRQSSGLARIELERERLGIDHAQAGALLADRWGMADTIVESIAWHHGGADGSYCPSPEAACVQLANVIAAMLASGAADQTLLRDALENSGLHVESLDELATQAAAASALLTDSGTAQRIAHLERLAQRDDLTGIANRRRWNHIVRGKLEDGEYGSMMVIDVDHFKQINDEYGHQAGDLVLGEVAHLLNETGYAGRLGGDEFAVWVNGPIAEAKAKAHQLLLTVAPSIKRIGDLPEVTLSIGLAGTPYEPTTLDDLFAIADSALYEAKRAGRAQAVVAPDSGPGEAPPVAEVA